MCLIIKTDSTKPISENLLKHMTNKNSDGWGMMWIANNAIQIEKSVLPFVDLWNAYEARKQWNPIIHLRWKTHGDLTEKNAHPFYCGFGIFLMHNGVVNAPITTDNTYSDTWNFIESWLKPILGQVRNPHTFIRSTTFKDILEHEIGTNNRIILGDRGGFISFNESSWHTIKNPHTGVEGLIVSNTYAWDAFHYGEPEKPKTTVISTLKPTGKRFNAWGAEMTFILANIYTDPQGQVWLDIHGQFVRHKTMDANLENIKSAYLNTKNKKQRKELRKSWKQEAISNTEQALLVASRTPLETKPIDIQVLDIKKKQGVLLLPPPALVQSAYAKRLNGTNNITDEEADARDEAFQCLTSLSQNEYTEILCKDWANHSAGTISSLVYTDPDDAAKVLIHLIKNHYNPRSGLNA